MVRRGDMREVELVEGDGPADDDALGHLDDVTSPERVPLRRRLLRAWPLAVVGLLVAGVLLVEDARVRAAFAARQDVLRDQEGFVADLGRALSLEPITELETDWAHPRLLQDVVLVTSYHGTRTELVVLDATTSAVLWRIDHGTLDTSTSCRPDAAATEGVLECLTERYEFDDDGFPVITASTYVRRDLRTGEVLDSTTGSEAASKTRWRDASLVVASGTGGTSLRLEAADGAELWSIPVLDAQLEPDEEVDVAVLDDVGLVSVRSRALVVSFDGTVVLDVDAEDLLGGPAAPDAVDLANEAQLQGTPPMPPSPDLRVEPLDDAGFAVGLLRGESPQTFVYDSQGELRYEVAGGLGWLGLDDGSGGDLLAWWTGDGMLLADRDSGDPRLRFDDDLGGFLQVIDGTVVRSAGDGVVRATDLRSGDEMWSAVGDGIGASDGNVILVQERTVSDSAVVALDVASGVEVWRLPLPSADALVAVAGGQVYVFDGATLFRLA